MDNELYKPIKEKIQDWINYREHEPPESAAREYKEKYRKNNDLDCKLTGGNLKADTIFSLWIPLRFTLVRINGYEKINKIVGILDKNEVECLKKVKENLEDLLPSDKDVVKKLSKLFELGQKRCNVMILKDRKMQSRSRYYDYMPRFLYECFKDGEFSKYFQNDEEFKQWIIDQKLAMFFVDSDVSKEKILDLAGTKDIKNNIPPNGVEPLEGMIDKYIEILLKRKIFIENSGFSLVQTKCTKTKINAPKIWVR